MGREHDHAVRMKSRNPSDNVVSCAVAHHASVGVEQNFNALVSGNAFLDVKKLFERTRILA